MNEQDFLGKLTDTIDTEMELSMETVLKDIEEWDSLAVVSVIALGNTSFHKKLNARQITSQETVADLYNLLRE